jgi:hypothetical protein
METIKKRPGYPDLYFITKITKFLDEPITIKPSKPLTPPDGSPIGMFENNMEIIERQCANFH